MHGTVIEELDWYKVMSTDPRDCVRVCMCDGRELVPYDTLESACKCCARSRHCAQWSYTGYALVSNIEVAQDVRGFLRITLYVD